MYENKYKNPKHTGSQELETFLQLLADLDEPIELFAMGGTAMVLKNIKESTKDIDFMTTLTQSTVRQLFTLAGLREKESSQVCNIWYLDTIRIDIFYDGFVLGVPFQKNWEKKAQWVKDIGKVKLYVLDWFDIIITKIARSEQRDIEDCIAIIKHQKLNVQDLKQKYYTIAETALVNDYKRKFSVFETAMKTK